MFKLTFLEGYKPWGKILMLMLLVLVCSLFLTLFGMLIAVPFFGKGIIDGSIALGDMSDPAVVSRLKYLQFITEIATFVVPAFLFVLFVSRDKSGYLGLRQRAPLPSVLIGIIIMLIALPLINWLSDLNMRMQLPASLAGVERWMMESETARSRMTDAFLLSPSVSSFVVNIFLIALIPALGEELIFRGLLQRLFREWTHNIHFAIFLSAFLFSAMHMQFYGFLPRFLMGALFGYLFYWSGSLWVPVLAHFVNNMAAVTVAFLSTGPLKGVDYNTFGSTENPLIIGLSTLLVVLSLFIVWRKRNPMSDNQISH
jgi:membrane protease YdiL (CAAX protease family)